MAPLSNTFNCTMGQNGGLDVELGLGCPKMDQF